MDKPAPVIDTHANHEENIERIVKFLGRNKLRLSIFKLVHGRGSRPKTVTTIQHELNLRNRQLILNQVNYLAKHKIILRLPTSRSEDQDRWGYGKNEFCMANKAEILRKVAKPALLARTPTKRRPQAQAMALEGMSAAILRRVKRDNRSTRKLRVLYLLANPASQGALRTDAEFRHVQEEVRASKYREKIDLIISPAADAKSILRGINDYRPQVVHFSGHGGGRGIWLDDGKVANSVGSAMKFDVLAETLAATDSPPKLLVLNACDTLTGAEVLLDAVEVVIAMSASISDVGAATFATQLYAAIASAQSTAVALQQGKIAMKAASLSDAHLPKMICRKIIDPKKQILVQKR
jgi:CHAT domain-containing protein